MILFLPAQVQVAQAVVEPQAFSQSLHPGVRHPHLPQVELHQAAVHCQHLREVHCPLLLRQTESFRLEESYICLLMYMSLYMYAELVLFIKCDFVCIIHQCGAQCVCTWWLKSSGRLISTEQRVLLLFNMIANAITL